jgi:hypothetical protein
MKLETCRRGVHVNRMVMRVNRDLHGNLHREEWHVCRFCKREVKHRTVRVVAEADAMRGVR